LSAATAFNFEAILPRAIAGSPRPDAYRWRRPGASGSSFIDQLDAFRLRGNLEPSKLKALIQHPTFAFSERLSAWIFSHLLVKPRI